MMHETYPPITELLPHRDSAVLLDAVLEDSTDVIRARVRIGPEHPFFVKDHGVPAWVGIELMAQAIAAHAGLAARREQRPPNKGMLLGSRRFETRTAYFPEGAELEVRAAREFGDSGGIAACTCAILSGGETLATATLIIVEIGEEQMP
jgi:predicted hotdog family 3-hydroxylacyl-ACP dehydratase